MPLYLVLLRVGFTVPSLFPETRCALTAPFHPYLANQAVYFLLHFPWARAPQALPGTLPYGARTFLHTAIIAIQRPSSRFPRIVSLAVAGLARPALSVGFCLTKPRKSGFFDSIERNQSSLDTTPKICRRFTNRLKIVVYSVTVAMM